MQSSTSTTESVIVVDSTSQSLYGQLFNQAIVENWRQIDYRRLQSSERETEKKLQWIQDLEIKEVVIVIAPYLLWEMTFEGK